MNPVLLKTKMDEQGITVEELAQIINRNPSTIFRKIKRDKNTFSVEEAKLISDTLNLTPKEATEIFFK